MPHANIAAQVIPLTGGGDTLGHVTVAATTILLPHTKVTLYSAGAGGLECIVVAINDVTGVVTLREIPKENDLSSGNQRKNLLYGGAGDLSAWTVVGGSVLFVHDQLIPVEPLYRGKV